jgi:hypothetical protein
MSGALALSALALPAVAHADEGEGDTAITKVSVNGGQDIVLGTTAKKKITVALTATDDSGISNGLLALWHGPTIENPDGALLPNENAGTCGASAGDPTTSTCKLTITVDPQADLYKNALAGTWKVAVQADGNDGNYVFLEEYSHAKVKRAARLTVNAAPEPVKKGKTITVTGKLSRANWETHTYRGYSTQSVKLQFRKKGSNTYTDLKTVKSSSTGTLRTTTKATVDGFYRFVFTGTGTTGTAKTYGDFVDVR